MEKVKDELNIHMNYANAQDHVPEAERNNRTIKERIRAAYHRLPYKAIPKIMIRYLAYECTRKLNLFPVKGGVSSYFSPRTILHHQVLDFGKHCTVPFGAYVQANNEPDPLNTNEPRTVDAIYLRPTDNQQGGHEILSLSTGRVLTRRKVTEIPVTDLVIKAVEKMADNDGIKTLKFTNKAGVELHHADWLAGVDYEQQEDDNDENDDDEDDDDENYDDDDDDEDDDYQEEVDREELDEISREDPNNQNDPNQNGTNQEHQDEAHDEENDQDDQESQDEDQATTSTNVRRSTRESRPVERLEPTMKGKSYFQKDKQKRV